MSLLSELKRRNVFRVAIAYAALAWLMAQVAELLLEAFGAPAWVLKSLIALIVVGFPFALFFAWAYELTPEGLRRERELPHDAALAARAARRLDRIIVMLLVLALAAFAWDLFAPVEPVVPLESAVAVTEPPPAEPGELAPPPPAEPVELTPPPPAVPENSIAVLPFANMSDEPGNEFFSSGISEEILNLLARVPGVHVTSRSSSFQFRGHDVHIPAVAQQLGVAYILEGSVRKSGNRVRITAQLIDADADRHMWSDTWDRQLIDIFAIQDDIAAAVVDALQETLLGTADIDPTLRTDSRAYEHYLRGRYLTWQRTPEAIDEAVKLFQRAIEIDPDYAPAYAGLGMAHYFRSNAVDVDVIEVFRQADAAIAAALELDPDSWEAFAARGLIRSDQGHVEEARIALRKAIELNPNDARAHYWLSNQYRYSDPLRALELAKRAYAIDPLARIVVAGLAWRLVPLGRYDEAMEQARKYHELFPDSNWAYRTAADVYLAQGRIDLALKSVLKAYRTQPEAGFGILRAPELHLMLGELKLAEAWSAKMVEVTPLWAEKVLQQVEVLAVAGQARRAVAVAREYAGRSDDPAIDDALAVAHLREGDYAAARAVMERTRPGLTLSPPLWDSENWVAASDYALALQHAGSAARAASVFAQVETLLESLAADGLIWGPRASLAEERAMLHAMQGRRVEALEALNVATGQAGALCTYCFRLYPQYEQLRGDPGFDALIAGQQATIEAQRQGLAHEGLLLTPEEVLAVESFEFDPLAR